MKNCLIQLDWDVILMPTVTTKPLPLERHEMKIRSVPLGGWGYAPRVGSWEKPPPESLTARKKPWKSRVGSDDACPEMGQKVYFRGWTISFSAEFVFLEVKSQRDTIHFLILFIETIPVVHFSWYENGGFSMAILVKKGVQCSTPELLDCWHLITINRFWKVSQSFQVEEMQGRQFLQNTPLVSVFASIENIFHLNMFTSFRWKECGLTHGPPVFELQAKHMAWVSLVVKNMFNWCSKKIQGDCFFDTLLGCPVGS